VARLAAATSTERLTWTRAPQQSADVTASSKPPTTKRMGWNFKWEKAPQAASLAVLSLTQPGAMRPATSSRSVLCLGQIADCGAEQVHLGLVGRARRVGVQARCELRQRTPPRPSGQLRGTPEFRAGG
jgi:hypothetical protein